MIKNTFFGRVEIRIDDFKSRAGHSFLKHDFSKLFFETVVFSSLLFSFYVNCFLVHVTWTHLIRETAKLSFCFVT